jgi:hypothetical protein
MAGFPFQTRKSTEEWLHYKCNALHDQIHIWVLHVLAFDMDSLVCICGMRLGC